MKTLVYGQFLPGAFARQKLCRALPAIRARRRHAVMRLRALWRQYRVRSRRRYDDVGLLDRRVLEEIGLTREQVSYDTCQPVWWR
jgi:hypothetical protein